MNKLRYLLILIFFPLANLHPVFAHQPVFEARANAGTKSSDPYELYGTAQLLGDPLFASYAVYGKLDSTDAIDMYVFTPQAEDTIPIELLVPAKQGLANFNPTLIIIGKYLNGAKTSSLLPLPIGFESLTLSTPSTRSIVYEPWSFQKFYSGDKQDLHVFGGGAYYLAVFEPNGQPGNYALGVGTKENFSSSVKDTATPVDVNTLVFEGVAPRQPSTPTLSEKQLVTEQKTPFQTLDSKLRLWVDLFFFYINRIPDIFTN